MPSVANATAKYTWVLPDIGTLNDGDGLVMTYMSLPSLFRMIPPVKGNEFSQIGKTGGKADNSAASHARENYTIFCK